MTRAWLVSLATAGIVVASSFFATTSVGSISPDEIKAGAGRVAGIPFEFGDWKMIQEIEPKERVLEVLQCSAYLQREYENTATGNQVSVVWVVGPSGPTSVHIPEICYSSQNHVLKTRASKSLKIGGNLWGTTFQSNTVDAQSFSVFYGWSRGQEWIASDNPRFDFGGVALLYKMQVSTATTDDSVGLSFVDDFVSEYWTASDK